MRIRRQNRRPLLFGAALLATLAATWWASTLDERDGETQRIEQGRESSGMTGVLATANSGENGARRSAAGATARTGTLVARREPWPEAGATLMQAAAAKPGALAPPVPVAPPVADVPPLPFRFIGSLEDRGERNVVLLEGKDVRILHAGDTIDTRYRVDEITSTHIQFTYLPLRQRQSLEISDHEPLR